MVKFSIIIPVYNAELTLKKCLDPITQQTMKNYEIIVVDDKSKDNSIEIAKNYILRLIELEKNSGSGIARNTGVKASNGKFLVFIDSDVIVESNWLEKIDRDFTQHSADVVSGTYNGSVGDSFIETFSFYELMLRRRKTAGFVGSFPSNNFAIKKEIFLDVGGFPTERNFYAEDLEFSIKIGKRYKIFWDSSIGGLHHFHPSLKKYLKQQYRFARDTIRVYKRNKWIRDITKNNGTYQGEKNKVIILLTFVGLLSFFVSIFTFSFNYFVLTMLFALLLDVDIFITFLNKKMVFRCIASIPLLLLRNLTWVIGMSIGVFKR